MNYELAKQLKDAGFPQRMTGLLFNETRKLFYVPDLHIDGYITCPVLSELIENCGYGFRELVLHTEHNPNRETTGRVWMAKAGKRSGGFLKKGHSPEEAVAKLWLELNKK